MVKVFFFSLMIVYSLNILAGTVNYTQEDSVKVVSLLKAAEKLSPDDNQIVFFAKNLVGTPYQSGTLECQQEEVLLINLRELDCTTFVETVLALNIASHSERRDFDSFVSALRLVRYRAGKVDGYCSRLHYFSDWALDNEKKGIVKEVSENFNKTLKTLNFHYMSSNADRYVHLKNNPENCRKIKAREQELSRKGFYYIPKSIVNFTQSIDKVGNGNIVAFVTTIDGLDTVHLGFALRENGKIKLLHASSVHKKVKIDDRSLGEYVLSGKNIEGLRVLTVLPY